MFIVCGQSKTPNLGHCFEIPKYFRNNWYVRRLFQNHLKCFRNLIIKCILSCTLVKNNRFVTDWAFKNRPEAKKSVNPVTVHKSFIESKDIYDPISVHLWFKGSHSPAFSQCNTIKIMHDFDITFLIDQPRPLFGLFSVSFPAIKL